MLRVTVAALLALSVAACHRPVVRTVQPQPQPAPPLDVLWHAPEPNRDLFTGVGGVQAPTPHSLYTLVGIRPQTTADTFDVADPRQRRWHVQLASDAPGDVVASRLLWGVGYHQVPLYVLNGWRVDRTRMPQPAARFRPEPVAVGGQSLQADGGWAYGQNPFVGSRELAGLIVLRVMFGDAELRDDRNIVYTLDGPLEGARAWYVADGFGQAFGHSSNPRAQREEIAAFERSTFIAGVRGSTVSLAVPAVHPPLLDHISVGDVHWICERLGALTDQQWRDAFRAGGYSPAVATRLIRRLKAKIAEGLAVAA